MIPPPDIWDPPKGPLYFTKNVTVADSSDPPAISSHARKCLLITHKKMNTPPFAGTQYSGSLTCGPTKLTGTEGFVNLVNMHDSSSSDHTMSIQRPSCFFNLWSSFAPAAQSSAGRVACSCLPWPAVLPRRPHRPYCSHCWLGPVATAASHRSRTSEPLYSSPHGLPLPRLPRLRIVPFLGLAVVHRPGALGAAWSTWSTTDMPLKWTVRGEADSWVHCRSKEVPPYFAENNDSSP